MTHRELTGTRIGDYRLVRELGRGGMGIVYEAHNEILDRRVALKVMPPAVSDTPGYEARFQREARSAVSIDHPGVVKVHHAGRTEDGGVYMVMEFIDGVALRQLVEAGRQFDSVMLEVVARDALEGLGAAHALEIIHRDIKPDNLLVTGGGRVCITDFGLARPVITPEQQKVTRAGELVGSPAYMSPEQWDGMPLDVRTDLYSLGVTLWQLAAGKVPFSGSGALTLAKKIATEDPEPLITLRPDLPDPLLAVIATLMEKERNARFSSAASTLQALDRIGTDAGAIANGRSTLGAMVAAELEALAARSIHATIHPPGAYREGGDRYAFPDSGRLDAARIGPGMYRDPTVDDAVEILARRSDEETRAVKLAEELADELVDDLAHPPEQWPPTAHPEGDVPRSPADPMDRLEQVMQKLSRVEKAKDWSVTSVASLWLDAQEMARDPKMKDTASGVFRRLRRCIPSVDGFTWLRVEAFDSVDRRRPLQIYRCDELARALGLPVHLGPLPDPPGSPGLASDVSCEFVLVPAGSYRQGSPANEAGRYEDEGPEHRVIVHPFLIARTPLTQAIWRGITGSNPSWFQAGRPGAPLDTARLPVEQIAADDITGRDGFLDLAGVKTLRLPSEAEWEYACRSGSPARFFFGDDESLLVQYAWYAANTDGATRDVATRRPNGFGLFDMLGNVWERCADRWHADYTGAPVDGGAREGHDWEAMVSRGGCCWSDARECRSACRNHDDPSRVGYNLGVRLAADLPAPPGEESAPRRRRGTGVIDDL